jgi:hypothetical protein
MGLASFCCALAALAQTPATAVDFNRDIRPILSENCYQCHGPDKNKRKADLRLDTKDGLFDEIDDVRPVVAGKPGESDLLRRILTDDDEDRMPPKKSNKSVTPQQAAKIRKWIEEGAVYKGHWAYIAPVRSAPPVSTTAAVTEIDGFILAKLREQNLAPGAPADRTTLCRRMYFDLLGLPPTPAQVKAFLDDKRPEAVAALADELLKSPHFGERMATFWLDQVRYADTIGYHSDNSMNVSPYRDWVIAAFNQNMPFNQFTIEQLAGDLLPNSTVSQKIATAYNRLLQTTEEGGAQPKEYEAKYAADRVRNVSAVWLAQTMGCCECHDHKFDPIATREFYGMEAFFADVQEASVGKREPGLPLPDASQQAALAKLDQSITAAQAKLNGITPQLAAAQSEWEKNVQNDVKWTVLEPDSFTVQGESKLKKLPGGLLQTVGKVAANENYTVTAHTSGKPITGFRLEVLPDDSLPSHGPGNAPNGNFVLTDLKIVATGQNGKATNIIMKRAAADFSQGAFSVTALLDPKRKNRQKTGWAILPEVGKAHEAFFESGKPVGVEGGSELAFTFAFQSQFPQHSFGKFRISATTSPEPARRALPRNVAVTLATDPSDRTAEETALLGAYFVSVSPLLEPLREQVAILEKQKQELLDALPKCLVTTAAAPREVRVLPRGNWLDKSGPVAMPVIPASLGHLTIEKPDRRPTRLDLAKWIADRNNPLTARVFVNRVWKMVYGQGIARKLDDFGSQGDWPTHPELLDTLAVDFMESGWDVKRLIHQLVTTDAYQRTSIPTAEQQERDPQNQCLSHQGRFRLDAEFVRDNALAVSGLLADRIGGKSVFPYQPAGYWSFLNFPAREWKNDTGEGLYRRGLYTHWQRTFLQPSLLAFDAPTREEAVCERTRSNVPQQALALLNDPTYVEAAKIFAGHILESGTADEERLSFAFQEALSRRPRPEEAALLTQLLEKQRSIYNHDSAAAQQLLKAGDAAVPADHPAERAAWTNIARVILNLHETITRN